MGDSGGRVDTISRVVSRTCASRGGLMSQGPAIIVVLMVV